ncbi:Photosystem II 5 kD protein [Euphorbia peplus]|nr:Photosystem II 5 kD protein [Euphorbia peplus]
MASMTMAATSFLAGSAITKQPFTSQRRTLIVAKASNVSEGEKRVSVEMKNKEEESINGRRDLVFAAAAAAAAFSFGKVAMAEDGIKRGTPEAKKKYGPVCVTMPTARICHKVKYSYIQVKQIKNIVYQGLFRHFNPFHECHTTTINNMLMNHTSRAYILVYSNIQSISKIS